MSSDFFVVIFFSVFCLSHVKVPEPDEPEPEHDTLQVPENAVWLSTLVTSPSRNVPLLLKLAYSRFPLKFWSKEAMNYVDDKGDVDKLRTARGKKTNQILGSRHTKCGCPRTR